MKHELLPLALKTAWISHQTANVLALLTPTVIISVWVLVQFDTLGEASVLASRLVSSLAPPDYTKVSFRLAWT